jgi:hypothetical protein
MDSKMLKISIYNTIILSFVLYGYETWSLVLKEELKIQVSENKVFKKFGSKKHALIDQFRILGFLGWSVAYDLDGEDQNCTQNSVAKHLGKCRLERPIMR